MKLLVAKCSFFFFVYILCIALFCILSTLLIDATISIFSDIMPLSNWLSTLAASILYTNMERISFNYSLRNIPVPTLGSYKLRLIEKIESVIKRMRWKAHFFLKEDSNNETKQEKETYGFKTRKCPLQCEEMEHFKKDMMNIVKNLELRKMKDQFQDKLKEDEKKINASPNILVFADKTSNIYEQKPEEHRKVLMENITKKTLNMKSTSKRKNSRKSRIRRPY